MKPFNWLANPTPIQREACKALDVSMGIEVILQMIEKDMLALETDNSTYLSVAQRACLLRLAITASKMLSHSVEQEIMRINVVSPE